MISKIHKLYVRGISNLIWILEKYVFYPNLKKYYQELIQKNPTSLISESGAVLDVGANKGQSLDFFMELFPNSEIHAFEPSPSTFTKLKKKILEENFSKVNIYNFGLSDRKAVMDFYESILDETSSFNQPDQNSKYLRFKNLVLLTRQENMKEPTKVNVVTLDEFINKSHVTDVILLKIDVEGHEREVFNGAHSFLEQKRAQIIQFERHSDDMRTDHSVFISNLLEKSGYVFGKSIRHPFGKFFEEVWIHPNLKIK